MTAALTLYTRKDCCLCDEMKAAVEAAAKRIAISLEEIDVDSSPEFAARYGAEVPVLFINGRKAFKYRVAEKELERRLRAETGGPKSET
ncbi:MAG TPA: glutaredoxin family protein [Candidatus Binatia bacterium]|jgi:glutaredoxin